MAAVIAILVAVALVVRLPMEATALTCKDMTSYLLPCTNYINSGGDMPSDGDCCGGLSKIVYVMKTTDDHRAACNCEKSLYENLSNNQLNRIEGLPSKCGVSFPYHFSRSIDCSKVN